MYRSPNGTIRNILGGTVFREPIISQNVPRLVPNWTHPICIGRHAYDDQYRATDFLTQGKGTLSISFTPDNGDEVQRYEVHNFEGDGIAMAMFNTDASIIGFAHSCFNVALERDGPCIYQQKTPFLKNMMVALKMFLKLFIRLNIKPGLSKKVSFTNIN